jgi:hypothetical protein
MNDQRQELLKTATAMVRDIEFLAKSEEFSRFMDHFKARADKLADEILHGDMTDAEREKLRQFRLGILEVLRGPQEIHRSNAMLLQRHGAD